MRYTTPKRNAPGLRQGGRVLVALLLLLLSTLGAGQDAVHLSHRIDALLEEEAIAEATRVLDSVRPASRSDKDLELLVACMDARVLRFKGEPLQRYALLDSVSPHLDQAPERLQLLLRIERARAFKDLMLWAEAKHDADEAIAIARRSTESRLLAVSLITRAEVEKGMSRYDDMLADLIEADKLCDSIGYDRGRCNVLVNWGNMLYAQDRYQETLEKYKAAYDCAIAHHFPSIARIGVRNMGAVTQFLEGTPKAIAIYQEALARNKDLGDRAYEAAILGNLAVAYNASGQYDVARDHIRRAMAIVRELGDTTMQVNNYNYLATSFWNQGMRDSALIAIGTTIALSRASHMLEVESGGEEKMYTYLKAMGREAEALEHLERHLVLKDSLDVIKEGELINRLEIGYETEKKERLIQVQQLEMEQDKARIRAREAQRNILLGTMGALLVVSFLIYRNITHKRKLAEQQKRISEQRVEQVLTEQELRLVSATMEGQDKERQRVAKDLHDRVGSLLSGVKLQFSALEERVAQVVSSGPEHFKKVMGLLDTAVGEVRRISHDLLSSNLAAFGLRSALTDLVDAVHVPGRMDVELSLFGVDERLEQKVEVNVYRIVQEAVSNALKHAQASTLSIQVTRTDGHLNILVEDNGRGFDPSATKQGMGTGNLQGRAAELGGTVHIDSRPGRGTSVSVDIPLD